MNAPERNMVDVASSCSGMIAAKVGRTQSSVQDLAIFRATPAVVSVAPANPLERQAAEELLRGHD